MNEEVSADKSPRSPSHSLEDAIGHVRKLHSQIGKGSVKPISAAIALGYKGLNGAALTTLGTLSQYGLIERAKGSVQVNNLAIRLMHPTGDAQFLASLQEAALSPKVFRQIHEGGLGGLSADVLSSHLVQDQFNPDRAKRAAGVYIANKAFAKIRDDGIIPVIDTQYARTDQPDEGDEAEHQVLSRSENEERRARVLANYTIPLGSNEASLVFRGDKLAVEDFDALLEYVEMFKKQFERRMKMWGIPAERATHAADGEPEDSSPVITGDMATDYVANLKRPHPKE